MIGNNVPEAASISSQFTGGSFNALVPRKHLWAFLAIANSTAWKVSMVSSSSRTSLAVSGLSDSETRLGITQSFPHARTVANFQAARRGTEKDWH